MRRVSGNAGIGIGVFIGLIISLLLLAPKSDETLYELALYQLATNTPFISPTPGGAVPTVLPTDTPVGLITRADAEMLFPAAVRFGLAVKIASTEIIAGKIRIFQPNSAFDLTREINPQKDGQFINEKEGLVNYVWEFAPDEAPEPFTPIRFEWEVTFAGGVRDRASGEVLFQDTIRTGQAPILEWKRTSPPVRLYTHNAQLALNLLGPIATDAYELARKYTKTTITPRLVIYDPDVMFCQRATIDGKATTYIESRFYGGTRRACNPTAAEAIYKRYGFTILRRGNLALNTLQTSLIDTLVGAAYDEFWAKAAVPAWFREGIIGLHNPTPNSAALGVVRERARAGRLLLLETLNAPPDALNASDRRVYAAQSHLLALYLADRYGAEAPFALAAGLAELGDFPAALRGLAQITPESLYADWSTWVMTEAAEKAVRWTPYLQTTPTPSATPTITPTRTATRPPTTPTPLPTITRAIFPTNTPPATPTPLPAGSLQRPSPAPTPPPNTGGCASAPLVLIPVGIVALLGRRSARRKTQ